MITFVADIENVSSSLSVGFVVDETVYGGSNPTRNQLAVILFLFKRDAQQNNTAISVDNSAPLTATQWQFTLPAADGVFTGNFFGFTIWTPGTYANLACVFYNSSVYIANTSTSQTPGTGGNWTLVTDIIATCTNNASVQQTQVYLWSSARTEAGVIGDVLSDLSGKIREGKCASWTDAGAALTGAAALNGAFACFRRADYINAQKDIDFLQSQTAATI